MRHSTWKIFSYPGLSILQLNANPPYDIWRFIALVTLSSYEQKSFRVPLGQICQLHFRASGISVRIYFLLTFLVSYVFIASGHCKTKNTFITLSQFRTCTTMLRNCFGCLQSVTIRDVKATLADLQTMSISLLAWDHSSEVVFWAPNLWTQIQSPVLPCQTEV